MGRSRTPQASSSVEPTTINAQSLKKRKIAGMLHFFKRAPADKATAKLQSALGALVTDEVAAKFEGEDVRRLSQLLAAPEVEAGGRPARAGRPPPALEAGARVQADGAEHGVGGVAGVAIRRIDRAAFASSSPRAAKRRRIP